MERRPELEVYHHLIRAAEEVASASHAGLRRQGLTPSRLGVVIALHERGPLTPKALARIILRSPGNLTLVLDNLLRDKFISREPDPKDRRRVLVALTDTGKKLATKAGSPFRAKVAEAMGVLSERELETLAKLCKKLVPAEDEK